MASLRTPLSLGASIARRGAGLGINVSKAIAVRVLPGQRSGDDTVRVMPTAPSPPHAHARADSAPSAAAPPPSVPPPPPGARPAPPPFDPPPLPPEEAELVAEVGDPRDVGATVHVEGEPFPGYDALRAPEIVASLQDADESTRAVVRLYEQANKQRRTILEATEW